MKRRTFLQTTAKASLSFPFLPRFGMASAFDLSPSNLHHDDDRVLVMVRLFGGNDGLNTVVPFTDDLYYKYRRDENSEDLSIDEKEVLKFPDAPNTGFWNVLSGWHELYAEGKMAVVQGVGYPGQSLSHFRSIDIWLSATDADKYDESGWIGRYFENMHEVGGRILPVAPYAIEFETNISRVLQTHRHPITMACQEIRYIPDSVHSGTSSSFVRSVVEEDYIRSVMNHSSVFLQRISQVEAKGIRNKVEYPAANTYMEQFFGYLARTARLIAGGLETKVYVIPTGMFDQHHFHKQAHKQELTNIDQSLKQFQRDLEALGIDKRVTVMVFSEFGRTITGNGSGTEHGAAAPVYIFGSKVRGGLYGVSPDMSVLNETFSVPHTIDFRSIYASILSQWFSAPSINIYPHVLPYVFEQLPLFYTEESQRLFDKRLVVFATPNPVSDAVTIWAEGLTSNDYCTLEVFDSTGKRVATADTLTMQNPVFKLPVVGLSSGMYTVIIRTLERSASVNISVVQ
jgi:uncharacterized protein (DUF1501 family)